MTYYYVTDDWKTLVSEGDPRAAYGVQARDLKRLGLTAPDGDVVEDVPEPQVMASANLLTPDEPEPEAAVEAKEAPKPADKAVKKPATKSRKEP